MMQILLYLWDWLLVSILVTPLILTLFLPAEPRRLPEPRKELWVRR